MKVILQKSVQKLGKVGDLVEAKPGYFRNFLQPRGMACEATTGALKKREEDLEALRAKAQKQHEEAVALAERISAVGSIQVSAKAGEGGRLYGKVTNKEIAEVLSKVVEFAIDKRGVKTLEDISALGTYRASIKLTSDVQAEINVEVQAEV